MKRKNGFTLVELLAVIVILAIIALIATPLILNVIDNAKKGAAEASANGYIDALEKGIVEEELKGNSISKTGVYNVSSLEFVNVKGDVPTEGWTKLEKGIVTDYSLKIDEYVINYENGKAITEKGTTLKDLPKVCKLSNDIDGNGLADISDEITCGTESFYVYSNDGTNIKMLSKYNLNIGDNKYPNPDTYNMQDENAKAGSGKIGSILYDENSVKIYLDEYKNKLEILGLKLGAENIRLIETDELFALGMKSGTNTISDKEWIYTVSYWVVPTDKSSDTWHVQSGGRFLNFYYQYAGDVNYFGVRPVIIIPSTEI